MNQGSSAILEARDVSASYSTYKALFGVSLRVPEGGIVALLGSNGAGKSTFARVISGLLRPTQGTVCFAGRDITQMPAYKIARLGLAQVPEGRGVFSSLSVEENLRVAFRHECARNELPDAMQRAFEAFPVLERRRSQRAGTLSGGEQRILSLAKVLAVPPRLLVADELSLGLAPSVVDSVYEGLVKIRQSGTALLVVEQQIDRALSIADRAVLLAHGSVAWEGPSADAGAAMEQLLGSGVAGLGTDGLAQAPARQSDRGTDAPLAPRVVPLGAPAAPDVFGSPDDLRGATDAPDALDCSPDVLGGTDVPGGTDAQSAPADPPSNGAGSVPPHPGRAPPLSSSWLS